MLGRQIQPGLCCSVTGSKPVCRSQRGFTLVELMVALGILLAVLAPVLAMFTNLENSYAGTQQKIRLEMQGRSALNLMANEIELAGSNSVTDTVTTAAVGPCTPCTISVSDGAALNPGDVVSLDTGASNEQAAVISSGPDNFTANLIKTHQVGATVVYPGYPYANGVYAVKGAYSGTCPAGAACGSELQFYGNVFGDGNCVVSGGCGYGKIYFIEYRYDAGTQRLLRSATPVIDTTLQPFYPICDHVTAVVFAAYPDEECSGSLPCPSEGNLTSLNLTLTIKTPYNDPQTGQPETYNLQRGVIEARNVAVASQMINSADASNVAPTPVNVPTLATQ